MILVKISPQGQLLWGARVNAVGYIAPKAVTVDAANNIYVAGKSYSGNEGFDSIVLPNNSNQHGFVAAYNKAGKVLWAKQVAGSSISTIDAMAIDQGQSLWIAGTFSSQITIGTKTLNTSGGSGFLAKMDLNGNFLSAMALPANIQVESMAFNPQGELIIGGEFFSNPAFGTKTLVSRGNTDIFIVALNQQSQFVWAKSIGYNQSDYLGELAVGPSGEIYVSGTFTGGGIFDDQFIAGGGNSDAFLAKLSAPAAGLPAITTQPRPVAGYLGQAVTLSVAGNNLAQATYQWYFNDAPIVGATAATLTLSSLKFENQGSYYVTISNSAGTVRSASAQILAVGEPNIRVSTLAGDGTPGYRDGPAGGTRLNEPDNLALLPDGNLLFADTGNHRIRIMSPDGAVSAFAGSGEAGWADGPSSFAKFNRPLAVFVDPTGDIFVAGGGDYRVRQISAFGLRNVTTVAGSGGIGYLNGKALEAQFNFPNDLVVDSGGVIYSCDYNNHVIRKISAAGEVTTFAGKGTPGYKNGQGTNALLNLPSGIYLDGSHNFYVAEWGNHTIRMISPSGAVSAVAGVPGSPGLIDGPSASAKFNIPNAITMDQAGNLYIADYLNDAIRKIDTAGIVTTLAGNGTAGYADGDRATSRFDRPTGILWHPAGYLLVAEGGNHTIRKIEWLPNPGPVNPAVYINLNPALTIYGKPGTSFRIEAAESLNSATWVDVGSITLKSTLDTWIDPQPASRRKRFYRLVQQ